jgi:uncharacterized C2H2 Zn-finger protein
MFGPTYIYKCPNCENFVREDSLRSGNTYGAKIYSDGKQIAPMLTEFPYLTKCPKCNTIFRLNGDTKVGEIPKHVFAFRKLMKFPKSQGWENAEYAKFLSLEDYFTALETKGFESIEDETYIREKIWWCYNDRIRKSLLLSGLSFSMVIRGYIDRIRNNIWTSDADKELWSDNLHRLLSILDVQYVEEQNKIDNLRDTIYETFSFNLTKEQLESASIQEAYRRYKKAYSVIWEKNNLNLKLTVAELNRI